MNYRWPSILLLGTLMSLPLSLVRADEDGKPAHEEESHHWKHDRGNEHEHGDLGITNDQKSKLKSIMEAQEKALKPFWRKHRDLTIKLADLVEDKASDADITKTLSDLKENREAMETESKRFKGQREAVFTPTQKARMMLAHRFGHESWGNEGHEKMDHRDGDWRKDDKDGNHHGDQA